MRTLSCSKCVFVCREVGCDGWEVCVWGGVGGGGSREACRFIIKKSIIMYSNYRILFVRIYLSWFLYWYGIPCCNM